MWVHHIIVGTAPPGQRQDQKGPVLYASAGHPNVNWTYFPKLLWVNKTVTVSGDDGTNADDCPVNAVSNPATCTLRKAILKANLESSASTPVLIKFAASPGTMFLTNGLTVAGQGYITIDGVESTGNPWIVGDASAKAAGNQDPFACVLDLNDKTFLQFTSSNNTIQGLYIKNTLPSPTSMQTKDLVTFAAGTSGNRVQAVKIEGGNTLSCSPNCAGSHDLFSVLGGDLANPSGIISNVEGLSGLDKGVKANAGGGTVKDSWFHHNYRGGVQATLNGKILAERNLVEKAGRRLSDEQQVDDGANGFVANGGTSTLKTDANVSWLHINNGVSVREAGSPVLDAKNDYVCGNNQQGVGVSSSTQQGSTTNANVTGVGAFYNVGRGAFVDVSVTSGTVNFGDPTPGPTPHPGNNAFAQNDAACDFRNNSTMTINAARNQWGPSGTPRLCQNPGTIVTSPVQNHVTTPITLDGSKPTMPSNVVLQGQTFRIRGSGFNAIDGNPPPQNCQQGNPNPPATSCCLTRPPAANVCDTGVHNPIQGSGNCVELFGTNSGWARVSATAVTPTTIVGQIPAFACTGGDGVVWVSKRVNSSTILQDQKAYCTNVAQKDQL